MKAAATLAGRIATLAGRVLWNTFFWTYERTTWQYDLMVIAILAFVWLVPPDWLRDPVAHGSGPIGWILGFGRK
jgi:hypothetical protein